eukprot:1142180-Pelagomonas_calceolata.AAC.1
MAGGKSRSFRVTLRKEEFEGCVAPADHHFLRPCKPSLLPKDLCLELLWHFCQQHYGVQFSRDLSKASAQITLNTILLCVGGVIYTPHTLEPLKELGLDTRTAIKLTLKSLAHSVQYAYELDSARSGLASRHALEKTSSNSHHQDQAQATASNPPDPH